MEKNKIKYSKNKISMVYYIMPIKRFFKRAAKGALRVAGSAARAALPVVANVAMAKKRMVMNKIAPALHNKIDSKLMSLSDTVLKKLSGSGAYTLGDSEIKHNTILRPTHDDNIPHFGMIKGGVRIQHREYIKDIYSSNVAGEFKNEVFRVNPALKETFPWLSALATNFERYRFTGLVFEFKSGSSDALNSINTALGYVVCASQYNSLADSFVNKQQMENTQYCVSVKPSNSVIHPIECDPQLQTSPVLYTRLASTGDISKGDLRLYDWCQEEIATVGMQGTNVNLGELWVSYDVILYLPVLSSGLALDALSAHYGLTNIINNDASLTQPVGDNIDPTVYFDSIGGKFYQGSSTSVVNYDFPAGTNGKYLINWNWGGTFSGALPVDATQYLSNLALTNCEILQVWSNGISPQNSTLSAGYRSATGDEVNNLYQINKMFVVNVINPNIIATIDFNIGSTVANTFKNPSFGDVVITQLNGNYQ